MGARGVDHPIVRYKTQVKNVAWEVVGGVLPKINISKFFSNIIPIVRLMGLFDNLINIFGLQFLWEYEKSSRGSIFGNFISVKMGGWIGRCVVW